MTSGSASARRAAAPRATAVRLVARGDGGHRQLELPLRALREIHSQPVRNGAGECRNDDLVELLAGQRIFDGGERLGVTDVTPGVQSFGSQLSERLIQAGLGDQCGPMLVLG